MHTILKNVSAVAFASIIVSFVISVIPAVVLKTAYSGTVAHAAVVPTCTLTASAPSVGYNGSSTLSWSTTDATSATLDQGIGSVMVFGGYALSNLTGTRTYTMTVYGPGGSNTCSTTVAVAQGNTTPTCSISVNPNSVVYGGTASIAWNSTNAVNASLSDIGAVATSGSYTLGAQYTSKTYTLTVTGQNGSTNSCSTTVNVSGQSYSTAPTCTLDSTTTTSVGGQAQLYWSTNNATAVSISGIGSVATSGSYTIYPGSTTTYILTAYGNGGSVNCTRTVTINSTYPNYYDVPTCSLTSTPAVVYNNGFATLNWNTTNATYVTIDNGIGQVSPNGTHALGQIYGSRTYTLTATGPAGSRTCTTTVASQNAVASTNQYGTVLGASTGGPTCGIVVRPTQITGGQMATVAWYTQNASSVYINGIGSVAASGTYAIAPNQTTTYSMTVRGYNGEVRTCDATIAVSSTGAYYPYNNNGGLVLGASTDDILPLRNVPYTGAEDVIYPLFVVALGLTAFYGASRMGKMVYA